MKRKTLRKSYILIPTLIMILTLVYFIGIFNNHDNKHYETVYKDSKYVVDMIAETIENLRAKGFKYGTDTEIYDSVIGGNVRLLDQKTGVNVRITTLDLGIIYEGEKINQLYSMSIFNPKSKHYNEIVQTMKGTTKGEYLFSNDDNKVIQMYWRAIPAPPDEQFYIVLTVDKEIVLNESFSPMFLIGMYIVCIVLIISLWDSVYLRLKNKE